MRMLTVSVALGTCLSLCVVAAAQEERRIDPSSPLNPLATLPLEGVSAFVERPLFSPSRRKPQDDAPVEDMQVVEASDTFDVKLLGIISSPVGSVARVAETDGTVHSLKRGDVFKGWAVVQIDFRTITFSKDDDQKTLALFARDDDAAAVADHPEDETPSSPSGIVFEPDDSADPTPPVRIIKQN